MGDSEMILLENARRVVLVEDEPVSLEVMTSVLQAMDLEVVAFQTADSALDFIRENPRQSLVLSDIGLPGMSGLDLLQGIRELGLSIPFVLISACHEVDMVLQSLRLGAMDYLQKPNFGERVATVVSNAVEVGIRLLAEQDLKDRIRAKDESVNLQAAADLLERNEQQMQRFRVKNTRG